MKYLIQNKKEFAIAIGAVVMTVINLVRAFRTGDGIEESVIACVLAIFTLLGLYYNIPTSEENCEATGEMRLKKAMKKSDYNGDTFEEDIEEDGEEDV